MNEPLFTGTRERRLDATSATLVSPLLMLCVDGGVGIDAGAHLDHRRDYFGEWKVTNTGNSKFLR